MSARQAWVDKVLALLLDLEWSGHASTAPAYMGGPSMGNVACCPECRGVRDTPAGRANFIDEAIGHRFDCKLAQQITELQKGGWR